MSTIIPTPTQDLRFSTLLVGEINGGSQIDLRGSGTIDEIAGYTCGDFIIRELPIEVDPRALGAFLFTGYPNSCRTDGAGVANPFCGGNYRYSREYSFAPSGHVAILEVTCELVDDGSRLRSEFRLSGDLPSLGQISSVSPIFELWSPRDLIIDGAFGVAWIGAGPDRVVQTAQAYSRYEPVHIELLNGKPKHRFLELQSSILSDGSLRVTQHSALVAS